MDQQKEHLVFLPPLEYLDKHNYISPSQNASNGGPGATMQDLNWLYHPTHLCWQIKFIEIFFKVFCQYFLLQTKSHPLWFFVNSDLIIGAAKEDWVPSRNALNTWNCLVQNRTFSPPTSLLSINNSRSSPWFQAEVFPIISCLDLLPEYASDWTWDLLTSKSSSTDTQPMLLILTQLLVLEICSRILLTRTVNSKIHFHP